MGGDWSRIKRLMEVSTMLYKCTYCVFYLSGKSVLRIQSIKTKTSYVIVFTQHQLLKACFDKLFLQVEAIVFVVVGFEK